MYVLTFVVILTLATSDVSSLPCLSSKAKKEFETVRQKLKTLHADLGKKVLGLDTDLKSMETNLASKLTLMHTHISQNCFLLYKTYRVIVIN